MKQAQCRLAMVMLAICSTASAASPGWRDLNHNGRQDIYEDPGAPVPARVADLLSQMTLDEKIGALLHGNAPGNGGPASPAGAGYDLAALDERIGRDHVTSFVTRLNLPPREFARQNNAVQRLAAGKRLGIPVTISSDPRHHFQAVLGASNAAGGFTQWPETLGLAALRDAATVRRFGDQVRQEYRAVGIQMALFPQVDVASEPRWPRLTGTFGADPVLVSRLGGAYVEGLQGGRHGVTQGGVAAVAKHWVGYGAAPQGFDAHNFYGREVQVTDASLALHVRAFEGALRARVAGIMPAYPVIRGATLDGKPLEPVAPGFNAALLQQGLRGKHRFAGLLLSDWAIVNDCPERCRAPSAQAPQTSQFIATPWGMEDATPAERAARAVNAGVDQLGGLDDPAPVREAITKGWISETRLNEAAGRVLSLKFELGLFDRPLVDEEKVDRVVGQPASRQQAERAQRESQVLLQNRGGLLPLRRPGTRVWLHGVNADAARTAGLVVVAQADQADVALLRMATPFERLHPHHFFGGMQNEGRLDFRVGDAGYDALLALPPALPAIIAIDMDRPAILANLKDRAATLLAVFGASDAALLDVVTGRSRARGRLPLNLPGSMQAVESQDPAVPDDDQAPLFRRGAGLGR